MARRESKAPPVPKATKRRRAGTMATARTALPIDLPGLNLNGKKGNEPSANKNGAGQNGQHSSMLDKMRDAMANLLAKLNMKPQGSTGSATGVEQRAVERQPDGTWTKGRDLPEQDSGRRPRTRQPERRIGQRIGRAGAGRGRQEQ